MVRQKAEGGRQNEGGGVTPRVLGHFLFCLLISAFCLSSGLGCAASKEQRQASAAVDSYFAGDYAKARQDLRPLAAKTDENFVLNNARLGSASLVDYQLDEAEAAFLKAYEVINSVGVNDGGRSLGAVLVDEKIKVWKGEPFERAMVNFYLGVTYYMRHDYGNARAAFENALFKLRDYAKTEKPKDDQYKEAESNFALGYVMLAKSWQRLGRDDLARANFERALQLQPSLAPLCDYDRNLKSNLLLVVDWGYGPKKVTDFDGAIVGFGPKPHEDGPIPMPTVLIDGRAYDPAGTNVPPTDLLVLAQDRKWQSIDTIRTVKSAVGTGLIAGGAGYGIYSMTKDHGMSGQDALITAGLIGTGLLLKATSQADVRRWEMLPRTTFVLPMTVAPGTHEVRVQFPNGMNQTWRGLIVPSEGEATYYFRMQRWVTGPFEWTGGAPADLDATPPAGAVAQAPSAPQSQPAIEGPRTVETQRMERRPIPDPTLRPPPGQPRAGQ